MIAPPALMRRRYLPSSLRSPTGHERLAVFGLFALDGVGFGSWAAYLPTYKARLGLSDGQLGIALFALVIGSLVSMPAAGRALATRSTRAVVLAGSTSFSLTVPLVAFAAMTLGNMAAFTAAALLFGATKGLIDVSANAHAIDVERDGGGPLLSTCHGGWSLGVLCGATAVAGALKLGMPPLLATALIAAGLLGLTAAAHATLSSFDPPKTKGQAPSIRPRGRLIPLAGLAFLGLFCEGAMGDWATIYLADEVRATASAAALGFAAYSLVMMFGRFAGDRFVAKLGPVAVLAVSGLSVALGLGIALALRTYPAAVAGFALVGLGVSNMVPILFRSAGRGADSGAAIASVSTVGYLGFLVGPPLIGALSQSAGLSIALSVVILVGLTIAAGSRVVADPPKSASDPSSKSEERTPHVQSEATA
ncbi:MFS transporter [Paludisphaera mucosa]|uniref:MFS transporter n=1 Tax=Paludisphaera mucosa TaxID=3030827 RepID=A0ABT6F899_9BACT|nr:MFS transporter [Paludisphaera mucosa]MDG3003595.1 MFS transporter [Paludisphaera mucosa]